MRRTAVLFLLFFMIKTSFSQNVGIGNTNPQAKLDVNGDIAMASIDIIITSTYNYALDVNTVKQSFYKLMSAQVPVGNFILNGITNGVAGRIITLINRTGSSMQIYNEDPSATSSNRISTGTNSTIAVYPGGNVMLNYDMAMQRWVILAAHNYNLNYFGGTGGVNSWDVNGPNISNNNSGNVGIATNSPAAKLTVNGNLALISDTVKISCDLLSSKILINNIAKPKSIFHIINEGCLIFPPPAIIGLSGGSDGKVVTIITHLNGTMLQHLQAPSAIAVAQDSINMIELYEPNTNGNINQPTSIVFNAGGSFTLVYDGNRSRWKLISYNGEVKSLTYGWLQSINPNDIYNPNVGNVGIGTANPTEKLDVNGNLKVRNNVFTTGKIFIGNSNAANAQLGISSTQPGLDASGINITQNTLNSGNNSYGLKSFANGSTDYNFGIGADVGGSGGHNYAGFFRAIQATSGFENYAIYATASGSQDPKAGLFIGNVYVQGNLSKSGGSFLIDHPKDPANKYLYHSFVESPDMMNIYNGNIITDENGIASVELPDYFVTLNKDFRYQLTVMGQFAQVIVYQKINNNVFIIKTDKPLIEVSWQVTGIRQDAWAKAHRIIPEVEKETRNKGKYLTPEEFGQPKEKGIHYVKTEEK